MEKGPLTEIIDRQQTHEKLLHQVLQHQLSFYNAAIPPSMLLDAGFTITPFLAPVPYTRDTPKPVVVVASNHLLGDSSPASTRSETHLSEDELDRRCNQTCSCICHRPSKHSTPAFLANLIGTVHIGCIAVPNLRTQCNEKHCRK